MDRKKSLIITSLFDGINYAYWKVHMKAFLQSLDEKVWLFVEVYWKKPSEPATTWDDEKIIDASFNSRALNALYIGVNNEEFKKIFTIAITKDAWSILEISYKGTKTVKTTKF